MTTRLLPVLLLLAGCCPLRDQTVYRTEIDFSDLMVSRQAPTVRRFLEASCACSEGTWSAGPNVEAGECENASDWYFTYAARWTWHVNMMRYNGGAIETDPGAAPEIHVSCALPELPAPVSPEATAGGES
jgi:hypothetical protein